jgi:methyl-accepting chemotaxis protein
MKKNGNYSIASLLIGVFLASVAGIAVILSLVMLIPFRNEIYRSAEDDTAEHVRSMQIDIANFYQRHADLLNSAGIGAVPIIDRDNPDLQAFQSYLAGMAKSYDDVLVMYFTTNGKWNVGNNWVIESNGYRPKPDWDNTAKDWFKLAVAAGGKPVCTEPYVDAMTGKLCITISKTLTGAGGRVLGVLAEDLLIDSLNDYIKKEAQAGSTAYLLDSTGIYLTGSDKTKIMKVNYFDDMKLGAYKTGALASGNHTVNTGSLILNSAEIKATNWSLVSTTPATVVFKNANAIVVRSIILLVALLAVLTVVLIFIIRRTLKPIDVITRALKDIAEGEGDLTRTLNVNANNEIGELALYFNQTMGKIRKLVQLIKTQAEALSGIGRELSNEMTGNAAAVDEITSNIESIKSQIVNQSASVTETSATMGQIINNIDNMTGQIEIQSEVVSKSSAAIEQMIANIQSVTSTLETNANSVKALTDAANVGRSSVQDVSADIQEIAKESEGLLEINAVMENIASQTNLLSMNAAIEAAHAGEAGKGFAVVAEEIGKLAVNSSDQSQTIGSVLKRIKQSIDKITASTDDVLGKFDAISTSVGLVTEQTDNIKDAMEQQNAGSARILEAISALKDLAAQVKTSSDAMQEGSRQVRTESQHLESATSEISDGMNEITTGADAIKTAITEVNTLSEQNKAGIESLSTEVLKFKIE